MEIYYIYTPFFTYKNQENRPEAQCSYFLPAFQPEDVFNFFLFSIHFQVSTYYETAKKNISIYILHIEKHVVIVVILVCIALFITTFERSNVKYVMFAL